MTQSVFELGNNYMMKIQGPMEQSSSRAKPSTSSSRWRKTALIAVMVLPLGLIAAGCSMATDPQTTINPKSDYGDAVQSVYIIVFWLAMIVFVAVMLLTLGLSIVYRERPGRVARQFHGNTPIEIAWTLIPILIVIGIAIPTFITIFDTTGDPPEDALVVEVTAHQWWFEFHYPDQGITTANEIHLPVDRAASFRLTSKDVIHSFWVPQLAGKVDLVPGHENHLWFTPNTVREEAYLGQCAEFCGMAHANMRFRVFVDTPEDFAKWVANEQSDRVEPATDELAEGERLFLSASDPNTGMSCITCHTIKGTIAPGVIGPNLTHVGSRSTLGAGIMPNDHESMVRWISNPDREKPGIDPEKNGLFMPAWEGILSREQIESIATYLLSLQ